MLDRSPEAESHPAIPGRGPSASPGPAPRPLAILWALSLVALIAVFQWPVAQRPLTPLTDWSNDSAVVVGLVAGAWILTALLAGLYRPFGPEVGLDALAVPLAVTSLGLSRGALVVGLGAFLGSLALDARERTWRPMVAAGRAGRVVLSSLAAGGLVAGLAGSRIAVGAPTTWAAAGVVYLTISVAAAWILADSRRRPTRRTHLPPVALEALAWTLGVVFAGLFGFADAPRAFAAVAIVAALAVTAAWAEAGRQSHVAARWRATAIAWTEAAARDSTTGLERGDSLRPRLELEIERSRQDGQPLSLALFDLDGLRRTNATLGLATGDERLRLLAASIGGVDRSEGAGFAARWHGGAVAWILPRRDGQAALAAVEAVRHASERTANPISCGVVSIPELAARGADDLLAMAEAGLRIAKRLGRSRALLDLGSGRFVDGEGRSIDTALDEPRDPSIPPPTPTFFA